MLDGRGKVRITDFGIAALGQDISPDDALEVVGSGGITIIDPSDLSYSSMHKARRGEPVSLIGVRLHILVAGGRFEMASREAAPE